MTNLPLVTESSTSPTDATLPASWYTDPAVLALEHERIFGRSWQYAGLQAQIPRPGDYHTHRVGGSSVIVVRARDGRINAFANVCRHRGCELVEGDGHAGALQCPYHAWTYTLDGALSGVPRARRNPEFSRAGLDLVALSVDTLGPLVFVNPDPDPAPLASVFGGWLERLDGDRIELDPTLRPYAVSEHVIEANWKLICENGFECYHCPVNHPELAASRDVRPDFWFEFHEDFTFHGLPSSEAATRGRAPSQSALLGFLWPNVFPIVRDGGFGSVLQALPTDSEHAIFRREYWFGDDVAADAREEMIAFLGATDLEDIELLPRVQRGQRSRFYDEGRLLLPATEPGVAFFQNRVRRALDGAPN